MQTTLTPPKTAPDPNRLDLSRIAQDLQIRKVQVESVVQLLDEGNTVVGTHYVGPTWQAEDGSFVRAARVAGAPAPIAGAVPWLLLSANAHGGPEGRMTSVTSIQRLTTSGGVAPAAEECNAATVKTEARVPYTADYFFYRANNGNSEGTRCGAE